MVSQMADAKNLGELFMAYLENLYNILCFMHFAILKFTVLIQFIGKATM